MRRRPRETGRLPVARGPRSTRVRSHSRSGVCHGSATTLRLGRPRCRRARRWIIQIQHCGRRGSWLRWGSDSGEQVADINTQIREQLLVRRGARRRPGALAKAPPRTSRERLGEGATRDGRLRAILEQDPDKAHVPLVNRVEQGVSALQVGDVRVCTLLQQGPHHLEVAFGSCGADRCPALVLLVEGADGRDCCLPARCNLLGARSPGDSRLRPERFDGWPSPPRVRHLGHGCRCPRLRGPPKGTGMSLGQRRLVAAALVKEAVRRGDATCGAVLAGPLTSAFATSITLLNRSHGRTSAFATPITLLAGSALSIAIESLEAPETRIEVILHVDTFLTVFEPCPHLLVAHDPKPIPVVVVIQHPTVPAVRALDGHLVVSAFLVLSGGPRRLLDALTHIPDVFWDSADHLRVIHVVITFPVLVDDTNDLQAHF
mmetsp:Transcript_7561/g.27744  ORF Transcript_7561/g.27744 Transcript_7561/m.27744 type:complete len:431 (+) Transcript_7561:411-1703(+)